MRINLINNFSNNIYTPSFGVNLQSKKLNFKNDDFFVKIKGYGTNSDWAKIIIDTADQAVKYIRNNWDFDWILIYIAEGVTKANQISNDVEKREHTGLLRIQRKGWEEKEGWWKDLITAYSQNRKCRYNVYADRFDYVVKNPLHNPYDDISLTRPKHDKNEGKFLDHSDAKYIDGAFKRIGKIYNKLNANYIQKEVTNEDLGDVNSSVAEIRWILAHTTPWERGSDAISNTFIRAIYKAMGIKTTPLKRGVSLDLEAYCTELDEYKKKFPDYFTKKPKIVD